MLHKTPGCPAKIKPAKETQVNRPLTQSPSYSCLLLQMPCKEAFEDIIGTRLNDIAVAGDDSVKVPACNRTRRRSERRLVFAQNVPGPR